MTKCQYKRCRQEADVQVITYNGKKINKWLCDKHYGLLCDGGSV